ncbi:hypothetical protein NQZ79_g7436 [Umbelopsis isabellina]|nr:hypothetical protein NQZ79_g7436 [Umbelopsis isabellina]
MGNKKSTLFGKKHGKEPKPSPATTVSSATQSRSRVMMGREYHNVDSSTYVLPKDDMEKDRLHQQHFIVKEQLGGNLLCPETTVPLFDKGIWALDVGCGPGSWVLDMATDFPSSEFEAFDMAETFPSAIHPPNTHFSIANLLEPFKFEIEFNFVNMRFFALALRKNEWAIAYSNIYKALKQGGYFQHVETTAMPNTEDSEINEVFNALASLQRKKGQEPLISKQLAGIAEEQGFEIVHHQVVTVEAGWGSRADQLMAETIGQGVLGTAPFLAVELGLSEKACREKVSRAIANFGPSKTKFYLNCFLARKQN